MRKFILVIATVLVFCNNLNAQSADGKNVSKRMNKTEMVKEITADMVKRYGLNEDQSVKLQKLNEEFAYKLRLGIPGDHAHLGNRKGNFGGPHDGNLNHRRNDGHGNDEEIQKRLRPSKEEMEKRMAEMKKNSEKYEIQLKSIMTEEQYAKYSEDRQKLHQKKSNIRQTKE